MIFSTHSLRFIVIGLLFSSLVFPFNSYAQTSAKIFAEDGVRGDRFGESVAISGEFAIIGATSIANESGTGAAYIFHRQDSSWKNVFKLVPDDGEIGKAFGRSVAIDGRFAIVGATKPSAMLASEATYFFERIDSAWVQVNKFTLPFDETDIRFGTPGKEFGTSVAISGNYAVVGARKGDGAIINTGAAYVYEFQDSAWVEVIKLTPTSPRYLGRFGHSVDVHNDIIIVGAWGDNTHGINAGAAYIFQRDNNTWSLVQKIYPSDPEGHHHFGTSVNVYDDYAMIGATGDDENGGSAGAVYVFQRQDSLWIQVDKLLASNGERMDYFGKVDLFKDIAAIGAYGNDKAYIFHKDGDRWTEIGTYQIGTGTSNYSYGYAIALDSSFAIVGAMNDDGQDSDTGSSYFFDIRTLSTSVSLEQPINQPESNSIKAISFPNPFTTSTNLKYSLPEASRVKISAYDILGRQRAVLFEGFQPPGDQLVTWDTDSLVSQGLYFIRITTDSGVRFSTSVLKR